MNIITWLDVGKDQIITYFFGPNLPKPFWVLLLFLSILASITKANKNVFLFQVVVCAERMVMAHELIAAKAAKAAKGDFDFTMTFIIEGSIPCEP